MSLPPSVQKAFVDLGMQQRGAPEEAMLRVQQANPGILSPVVEDVGDLIHRMTAAHPRETAGYSYVREKVRRTIRYLTNKYGPMLHPTSGFEKEHRGNIESNARHDKKTVEEYERRLNAALQKYADEHRKLVPLNEAQWTARQAAISLGAGRWGDALWWLEKLNRHLGSEEEWVSFAHQYELKDGLPVPYEPRRNNPIEKEKAPKKPKATKKPTVKKVNPKDLPVSHTPWKSVACRMDAPPVNYFGEELERLSKKPSKLFTIWYEYNGDVRQELYLLLDENKYRMFFEDKFVSTCTSSFTFDGLMVPFDRGIHIGVQSKLKFGQRSASLYRSTIGILEQEGSICILQNYATGEEFESFRLRRAQGDLVTVLYEDKKHALINVSRGSYRDNRVGLVTAHFLGKSARIQPLLTEHSDRWLKMELLPGKNENQLHLFPEWENPSSLKDALAILRRRDGAAFLATTDWVQNQEVCFRIAAGFDAKAHLELAKNPLIHPDFYLWASHLPVFKDNPIFTILALDDFDFVPRVYHWDKHLEHLNKTLAEKLKEIDS